MKREQIEWLKANPEAGFAIFKDGYKEGAAMKWPEMVFWMGLILFLFNLAVGGL